MKPIDVVCLTEAGASSGMGHVRRTMRLANALEEQGAVCRFGIDFDEGRQLASGFPVFDVSTAVSDGGDILIVDGYHFTEKQMVSWSKKFSVTVLIDDLAERPLPCDILINHNIYGQNVDYSGYDAKHVFAGSNYAMIDPKFPKLREHNRRSSGRALICFGGGDTANFGLTAARILSGLTDIPIDVAMGTSTARMSRENVYVHRKANMVELMEQATFYFGALGVSFIEALASGLPAIGVVTADNQKLAARAAQDFGIQVFPITEINSAAQAAAALAAKPDDHSSALNIDGQGAVRLAVEILNILKNKTSDCS